jgi:hypothetical protein
MPHALPRRPATRRAPLRRSALRRMMISSSFWAGMMLEILHCGHF